MPKFVPAQIVKQNFCSYSSKYLTQHNLKRNDSVYVGFCVQMKGDKSSFISSIKVIQKLKLHQELL